MISAQTQCDSFADFFFQFMLWPALKLDLFTCNYRLGYQCHEDRWSSNANLMMVQMFGSSAFYIFFFPLPPQIIFSRSSYHVAAPISSLSVSRLWFRAALHHELLVVFFLREHDNAHLFFNFPSCSHSGFAVQRDSWSIPQSTEWWEHGFCWNI